MFAIIKRGAASEGLVAIPEEGSSFSIPTQIILKQHIVEGQELTQEQFECLQQAVQQLLCDQKGLSLLVLREHSAQELQTKLQLKGFTAEQARHTVKELIEQGSLDELRYAKMFVRSRMRKNPEGAYLMEQRLAQKGISQELARAALAEYYQDEESKQETIAHALDKLSRRCSDPKKLAIQLRKKGFSHSETERALGITTDEESYE